MATIVESDVVVWNPNTGAVLYTFRGQSNQGVEMVSWSPDGKDVSSISDQTVQVWNAHTGQVMFQQTISNRNADTRGVSQYDTFAMFAHHNMNLAFTSNFQTIEVWNVATNTKITSAHVSRPGISSPWSAVAWSPDDSEIASISGNNVDIWNAQTGTLFYRFPKQGNAVVALAWSPDGRYIISSDVTTQHIETKIWIA